MEIQWDVFEANKGKTSEVKNKIGFKFASQDLQ